MKQDPLPHLVYRQSNQYWYAYFPVGCDRFLKYDRGIRGIYAIGPTAIEAWSKLLTWYYYNPSIFLSSKYMKID